MSNFENPINPEQNSVGLAEKIKNTFGDSVKITDRTIETLSGEKLDPKEFINKDQETIEEDFRIIFNTEPTKNELADLDHTIIEYFQEKYQDQTDADTEITTEPDSIDSNQRVLDLTFQSEQITVVRTVLGESVEISAERK